MAGADPRQIGEWFAAYGPRLRLYARQWLGPEEADDALQEVFLRLAEQDPPPRHLRAWLFRVVRNEAISRLRARSRRSARDSRAAASRAGWFEPRPDDALDADAAARHLAALPQEQREAIVLRLWGGLTLAEVGEVVGCSAPTALRRYEAGLAALRKVMEVPCDPKMR